MEASKMIELIVWILAAALTISTGVIGWTATNLVAIKVSMAKIDQKLDNVIKDDNMRQAEFATMKEDIKSLQRSVSAIEARLNN